MWNCALALEPVLVTSIQSEWGKKVSKLVNPKRSWNRQKNDSIGIFTARFTQEHLAMRSSFCQFTTM